MLGHTPSHCLRAARPLAALLLASLLTAGVAHAEPAVGAAGVPAVGGGAAALGVSLAGSPADADEAGGAPMGEEASTDTNREMYRLYNESSGEHFYTGSEDERDALIGYGWWYEGVGWVAPASSSTPVHRLYNANSGEHHYTTDPGERNALVAVGWKHEGIGWYSDDSQQVPLYRLYNPNELSCNHNYTVSSDERAELVKQGWRDEGVAWYGVRQDAMESLNGWWQSVGSSGMYWRHIVDGRMYDYRSSQPFSDSFRFVGSGPFALSAFGEGSSHIMNSAGYQVVIDGDPWYLYFDDNRNMLYLSKLGTRRISFSDSYHRAAPVPGELMELAHSVEG